MLTEQDLLEIERAEDPATAELFDLNRAMSMANQIYGRPQMTQGMAGQLAGLEQRAAGLQPIQQFGYGELGGGAIPGNPYSVDRRGLYTGLANLTAGLVNRERTRRVQGDPRTVERARGRIGEITQELAELQGREDLSGSERRKMQTLQSELDRQQRRAERYGGFADTLAELRGLQADDQRRQESREDFLRRVAPEQARIILQDNMEQRRAGRDDARDTVKHNRDLELIEQRGYQSRLTADHAESIKRDPNNPDNKAPVYQEIMSITKLLHPELEFIPDQIRNLRMTERSLRNNGALDSDPDLKTIVNMISDLEKNYKKVSNRALSVLFEIRPQYKGLIDVDEYNQAATDGAGRGGWRAPMQVPGASGAVAPPATGAFDNLGLD